MPAVESTVPSMMSRISALMLSWGARRPATSTQLPVPLSESGAKAAWSSAKEDAPDFWIREMIELPRNLSSTRL